MKVAIIILIVLYFLIRKSKSKTGVSKRPLTGKPSLVISNDKIILISNATLDEVKKALKDFCNQYNQEDYAALPRVYSLFGSEYTVTFPYNIDLTTFCFAVNYLAYPVDIKWKAEIHGWSTVSKNEGIDQEDLEGKVCMFYLVDDKEYDNVYLTSSDNFCYKIPFTNFKPKAITPPIELFRNLPQKLADLSHLPYEDIE
ncbi:hypothetical protein FPZ42_15345 [Mucilaginibacter achroorhodeus]|uniref:Uncharacterized protein n=1 Tax=Mucilaginibacter achroorhodeus TaxID=2599294 RepID=A0A563TYN3_9SPHI|nr:MULTISPECIES: hypothetical protein [Mucilaginibacter]QXV65417.1 hypothetical protein INP83_20485 [Mucilaginibacter sp. 21P]TWR24475.1 hypothetical protein FPZ42_15345 [Mucilaginibacter achroorhodeus]